MLQSDNATEPQMLMIFMFIDIGLTMIFTVGAARATEREGDCPGMRTRVTLEHFGRWPRGCHPAGFLSECARLRAEGVASWRAACDRAAWAGRVECEG